MEDLDRQLLNTLQSKFPITPRPYLVLGEQLGITEDEALERVQNLTETGVIRKIGASFDTRRLGHTSVLVAAKVPAEQLQEVAGTISAFPQVTHNYGRDFEYNLWFTLVCRDADELGRALDDIQTKTGISDLHILPSERVFKIKVDFEF